MIQIVQWDRLGEAMSLKTCDENRFLGLFLQEDYDVYKSDLLAFFRFDGLAGQ